MSISPTSSSTVADYFFVTGLCDDDLLLTYQQVQKGFDQFNEVSYYLNQQTSAAEKLADISTLHLDSPHPVEPNNTNKNTNTTATTTTLTKSQIRRKRGFSLPPISNNNNSNNTKTTIKCQDSLNDVLDHVQTVIDNFDKERDTARDNVISITSPPQLSHSTSTDDNNSTRSTNKNGHSKRLSLYDTTWHNFDSLKSK